MVVSDDFHAVQASMVSSVMKPALETVLYLIVFADGQATTLWFDTLDARDSFFKLLVDAMGK